MIRPRVSRPSRVSLWLSLDTLLCCQVEQIKPGRSLSFRPFAVVCSLAVVVLDEPCETVIQFIDGLINFRAEGDLVELFEDCAIESYAGTQG